MTVECPQCKAPQPRPGSRFCNQCGADLRLPENSSIPPSELPQSLPPTGEPNGEPNAQMMETFSTDAMDAAEMPLGSGKAMVRILMRDGGVVERELSEGETKIGKGPLNDIILADPAVSTSHALIRWQAGSYIVTDLGSRNGTMVNDVRLSEPRKLTQGDRIKMGRCMLTFRMGQNIDTVVLTQSPVAAAPQVAILPNATEDELAEALIAAGLVDPAEMPNLRGPGAKGRRLFRVLIEEQNLSDLKLRDVMSSRFGIPVTDLTGQAPDQGVAAALTPGFLREHLLFPSAGSPDRLVLTVADPTDVARLERVKTVARRPVEVRLAAAAQIATQLDQLYSPRLIGVMPSGEKIEALLTLPEMEIGKAAHNHIILTHPTVSNTHAVVLARNGGHSIVDLGSSNGTFVNGVRLGDQAHTLQHGDKVQIAEVLLTFRNPAETTESKTARLSPEILEEIRRRANLGLPIAVAAAAGAGVAAVAADALNQSDDEERGDKKKKKKKDDDRLKAALVNSMSRLVATVVGSILTVVGTIYLLRSPSFIGGNAGGGGGGVVQQQKSRLSPPGNLTLFSDGAFEASGATWIEDTNTVLIVDDGRPNELLLMTVDLNGKQVGPLTPVPHSGEIIDPEAVTHDGSWVYVVGSQGKPENGAKNSLMRLAYDRQTKSIRGTPEVIPDLRAFLLSQVAEIRAEGQKPGTKGGLNIEGLAWDPINNRLLLGLRSPLINNRAVVVPLKLKDPLGPFATSNLQLATPRLIQLDLGGQGIRDLDYNNHLKSFLIISGATELSERTDFGLWEWSGEPDQSRVEARPRAERTVDERLKPEGITNVTVTNKSFVLIVCDASGYLKLDYVEGR